jgi:hypothetical protein
VVAMTTRPRWSDLSECNRRLILVGAAVEGCLEIAALVVDLRRRPAVQVHGRKSAWATAAAPANSAGTVPLA